MKFKEGKVHSIIDSKTVKVETNYFLKWPKLGKLVKRRKFLLTHYPLNKNILIGDKVKIKQIAKVSKMKSYMIFEIK